VAGVSRMGLTRLARTAVVGFQLFGEFDALDENFDAEVDET
jgi:hypothetical protein